MIAPTPAMAVGFGARAPAGPPRCRLRRSSLRRRGSGLALGGERHHHRHHPGDRLDGRFRALPHRLPGLHDRGIDRDREEHLAVGDQNVGKHTSLGERHPVRTAHRFEARQDLVARQCHFALHDRRGPNSAGPDRRLNIRTGGARSTAPRQDGPRGPSDMQSAARPRCALAERIRLTPGAPPAHQEARNHIRNGRKDLGRKDTGHLRIHLEDRAWRRWRSSGSA